MIARWKYVSHENVLPFLGVSESPFWVISPWMPNGNIFNYTQQESGVNRLKLVSVEYAWRLVIQKSYHG